MKELILMIGLIFLFVSCKSDAISIEAKFVTKITKKEYERVKSRMSAEQRVEIDIEVEYIFVFDKNQSVIEVLNELNEPKDEIILTSMNGLHWEKSLDEFLDKKTFETQGLTNLKLKSNLNNFTRVGEYYLWVRDCNIDVIKSICINDPTNRFYLSTNVLLDRNVQKLNLYFAKSVNFKN